MATPVFCCGAECGIVAAGAAGGTLHWNVVNGAVTADTVTVHSPGLRSYKFTTAAGAAIYLSRTITGTPTILVGRFYVYFETLPSADCRIVSAIPSAGGDLVVLYQSSSQRIFAFVGGGAVGSPGVSVTTGQWYRVDFKGNTANPRTMDVQVDGTDAGQSSFGVTAGTVSSVRFGVNTSTTTANSTHYIDDIIVSATSGDYPIGAGQIVGLVPNRDGAHVFDTAGDFMYDNITNVATGATDTFNWIDDRPMTGIAEFLAIVAASNTEYLEWGFQATPSDVSTITGVEVVGAFHGASTTTNKTTLRINDGGTLSDVATDLDFSNTTITYHSKHYATAPSSGVAWTKAKVDAILARGNSSYGTVDETPVPFIDALMLEVDYTTGGVIVTARPEVAAILQAINRGAVR